MAEYDLHEKAAGIVRDAGGELVGRTRLQKVVYLSQLAGYAEDFPFEYKHFGPFSQELADAMEIAVGLKIVEEQERPTDWGGWYSIFKFQQKADAENADIGDRTNFVKVAAEISAIELELAATAAYLFKEQGNGERDPWEETRRLKPEKAGNGRLDRAKLAYAKLQRLKTPKPLPEII